MPDDSTADVPLPDKPEKEVKEETALEEAARERFGLREWDRPALFRETANAASDTDLPFWSVLMLSGAIATLGLALDATAVVIGAMLIAPLLGPVLGLGMALAVGDGRLALQTAVTIFLGTLGVVALAAVLTLVLPFQSTTNEILARTRPTTLDLAIAVASGLAGAVVTLSREKRLSASIPGVAIAVALIPPLGVAGFGIGTGWQWGLIKGSMLLFGANLGGIVLSAMLAFLLVGMHRPDVVKAARRWHQDGSRQGLSARLEQAPTFRRLRVFDATWARVALVMAFVGAVAIPLSSTLEQVVRETRVQAAIAEAAGQFDQRDRSFIISRNVVLNERSTDVRLRVATTQWLGADATRAFEQQATARAGEPVTLQLEQVPTEAASLDSLASAVRNEINPRPDTPAASMTALQQEVAEAMAALVLPDSVQVVGADVSVGGVQPVVRVAYAAPERLSNEAESMLGRQAARTLGLPQDAVRTEAVVLRSRPLPTDSLTLDRYADLLRRFGGLHLLLRADSARLASTQDLLRSFGVPDRQLHLLPNPNAAPRALFTLAAPDSSDREN